MSFLPRLCCALLLAMLCIRAVDFFWFDTRPLAWLAHGIGMASTTYATLTARSARYPAAMAAVFFSLKVWDETRSFPEAMSCEDASGKTRPCVVLVTGANSGIGFATSQALYEQGHTVGMGNAK